MRKLLVFVVSLFLLAGVATAWSADASRLFAPVQDGPARNATETAPWAPDRVLVQLTKTAYEMTSLAGPVEKSAGTGQLTGLISLDAAMDEMDVRGLRSAFPNVHRAANKSMTTSLGSDRWFIVDLAAGADVPAAVERLSSDPNVAFAEPDLVAFPHVIPDDPLHSDNWGHNNTVQMPAFDWGGTWSHTGAPVGTYGFDSNAQAAWNAGQGYGDPNVVIAIIDSGVDVGHPDLLQVTGYDFGDNDSDPDDDSGEPGHGTACAGIAAAIANNTAGADGVAGGCSIMPLKAADSAGNMYLSAVANAIFYAADNGADVISMSLGAATTSHLSTDGAITYAYNNGVTILASTGNENTSQIGYPAYHALVIGVGAASPCGERKRSGTSSEVNPGVTPDPNGSTCDEERWWGSNYGSISQDHQGAVDVIAPTILPTTDIQGTGGYASGDYSEFFNGTSCSSPYAAGVAALIKSANPSFMPTQVRAQLVGTAEDVVSVESGVGWDRYAGYGMVDAAAAVGAVIPPAVVADFEADQTSGCTTLTANFTDLSTGSVDAWIWDFGDGLSSLSQNPSHTYAAPGVYDVSLTASGPEGGDSTTKYGYIVVGDVPVASFESTGTAPIIISAGTSLPFTDLSTGSPTSWAWDFGDGGTSVEQNPTHVYDGAGFFTVALTATNDCGSDTDTQVNMIYVIPPAAPTADFSYTPASGDEPLEVSFTDLSTGTPTSWAWDFGDGGMSTEQNPVYIYASVGTYDVSLTATNAGGSDAKTVTDAVTVNNPLVPVVAAFSMSDTLGVTPLEVTFTDLSTGDPTSWAWDFGDGGTSTEQNPVYIYTSAGTYDVSLTATNAGDSDTMTVTDAVTVNDPFVPVVAAFSVSDTVGLAPLDITFTDESTGSPTSWTWDFGDGGTSTEQNPVHNYTDKGLYDVRLIAANESSVDTMMIAALIDIVGVSGVGDGVPASFGLVGNYPNPFNPATTIVFSMEKAGHARLEIFDVSGRRVATLVDGSKSAGRHEINWRPDDLSSGVYFSRLVSGDEMDTQRLTLLK